MNWVSGWNKVTRQALESEAVNNLSTVNIFFRTLLETKGLFRRQQRDVIPGAFLFDSWEHKVHLTAGQNKTRVLIAAPRWARGRWGDPGRAFIVRRRPGPGSVNAAAVSGLRTEQLSPGGAPPSDSLCWALREPRRRNLALDSEREHTGRGVSPAWWSRCLHVERGPLFPRGSCGAWHQMPRRGRGSSPPWGSAGCPGAQLPGPVASRSPLSAERFLSVPVCS